MRVLILASLYSLWAIDGQTTKANIAYMIVLICTLHYLEMYFINTIVKIERFFYKTIYMKYKNRNSIYSKSFTNNTSCKFCGADVHSNSRISICTSMDCGKFQIKDKKDKP